MAFTMILVSAKASRAQVDSAGYLPLTMVAGLGSAEGLLHHRADVNAIDAHKQCALGHAVARQSQSMIALLIETQANLINKLHNATVGQMALARW